MHMDSVKTKKKTHGREVIQKLRKGEQYFYM